MSAQQKQAFSQQFDWLLPAGYVNYLFSSQILHGAEGAYLVEASELQPYNTAYAASDSFPGYFLIGSDGGGEALALEKATGYFVLTPFIGHDEETPIIVGRTGEEFSQRFQAGNLLDD